jgi:hypothetical protein
MPKYHLICLILVTFFLQVSCRAQNKSKYNLDVEEVSGGKPKGWVYALNGTNREGYFVQLDSVIKQHGKYALCLASGGSKTPYGAINYNINKTFDGSKITLKGYVKTDSVKSGYAGLWMRIDGKSQTVAFDNMSSRGIKGTTGWTEYTIELPYNRERATSIYFGVLLVGDGKVWLDNLSLMIDGKPVEDAKTYIRPLTIIEKDSVFNTHSKIDTINTAGKQTTYLTLLGQLWGFLKYHHPAVAQAKYNWDAELFRILPAVQKVKSDAEAAKIFEAWVDMLGKPAACTNCEAPGEIQGAKLKPEYGSLFNNTVFSKALKAKLQYILANRNTGPNWYISMSPGIGNPDFSKEVDYIKKEYPDAGYRILALYRYWNMINYFFPYKHLIKEDWANVLTVFVPKFAKADNNTTYQLAALELIASIHDTHANIWSSLAGLNAYRGSYSPPFQAKFIEDKLIITGYYNDTAGVKEKFKIGNVITKINGVPVTELIKKYQPITPGSNYETQLRDMPQAYLLRATKPGFTFEIDKDGKRETVAINGLDRKGMIFSIDYDPNPSKPAYYLIDKNIGYVYPGKYKDSDLQGIKKEFANTKGIIIDMRCYPSAFMPFTFGQYLKATTSPFVKFTLGNVAYPGLFNFGQALSNGGPDPDNYKGKVVIIVNAQTQSQAEYTTIAFQSAANVTVLGSTTAAADGNVSSITLPGNISTLISGIGVYYPDGTETQRAGVKIDVPMKPTIKGIKEGRDELLEKAKELVIK